MQRRGVLVLRTDFQSRFQSRFWSLQSKVVLPSGHNISERCTPLSYGFSKAFSLPFLYPTVAHKLYVHTLEGWLRPGCLGDGNSLVLLLPIQTVLQKKYVPPSLCTLVFQNIPEIKLKGKDRLAKQQVYDHLGRHQQVGGRRNYTDSINCIKSA